MSYTSWPNDAAFAFAIRDDDVSYFTPSEKLEKLYKNVWQEDLKVSFGAIPMHRATIAQLNVPPEYRGQQNAFKIQGNNNLVAFLKSKLKAGKAEILLHGYCHDNLLRLTPQHVKNNGSVKCFSEFYGLSEKEVTHRIIEGKTRLENNFNTKIQVFAPPNYYMDMKLFQALKKTKLACSCALNHDILRKLFFSEVSTCFRYPTKSRLSRLYHFTSLPFVGGKDFHKKLAKVSEVPILELSYILPAEQFYTEKSAKKAFQQFKERFRFYMKNRSYFIMNVHYHNFFYDWREKFFPPLLKKYFDKMINFVASHENVWPCTLSEMLSHLQ